MVKDFVLFPTESDDAGSEGAGNMLVIPARRTFLYREIRFKVFRFLRAAAV